MPWAAVESGGLAALEEQLRLRVIRQCFNVWEVLTLQLVYARQRRIVAAETATSIHSIKKAITYWRKKAKLRKVALRLTAVPRSRVVQAVRIWRLRASSLSRLAEVDRALPAVHQAHAVGLLVANFYVGPPHFGESSAAGPVRSPRPAFSFLASSVTAHRSRSDPTTSPYSLPINGSSGHTGAAVARGQSRLHRGRRRMVYSAALAVCGVVSWINGHGPLALSGDSAIRSLRHGDGLLRHSLVSRPPLLRGGQFDHATGTATLLTVVRVLYASRCPARLPWVQDTSQLLALDFVRAVWPLHLGRLWNRHEAIARLLRSAFLKVRLRQWHHCASVSRQYRRAKIAFAVRSWRRAVSSRQTEREKRGALTRILQQQQRVKCLRKFWGQWRVAVLSSLRLADAATAGATVITHSRWKYCINAWRHVVLFRKALRSRERFVGHKWAIVVGLWNWRQFASSQRQLSLLKLQLEGLQQTHCLQGAFRSFRDAWRQSVEARAVAVLVRHVSIRKCFSAWRQMAEQRGCHRALTAAFYTERRRRGLVGWKQVTRQRRVASHYTAQRLHMQAATALNVWKAFCRRQRHLVQIAGAIHQKIRKAMCGRVLSSWLRVWRVRRGCRTGVGLLSAKLYLCFAVERWVYARNAAATAELYRIRLYERRRVARGVACWAAAARELRHYEQLRTASYAAVRTRTLIDVRRSLITWQAVVVHRLEVQCRGVLWTCHRSVSWMSTLVPSATVLPTARLDRTVAAHSRLLKAFLLRCQDSGHTQYAAEDKTGNRLLQQGAFTRTFTHGYHKDSGDHHCWEQLSAEAGATLWARLPILVRKALLRHVDDQQSKLRNIVACWKSCLSVRRLRSSISCWTSLMNRRHLVRSFLQWRLELRSVLLGRALVQRRRQRLLIQCWNLWEYHQLIRTRDRVLSLAVNRVLSFHRLRQSWDRWKLQYMRLRQLSLIAGRYRRQSFTLQVIQCLKLWRTWTAKSQSLKRLLSQRHCARTHHQTHRCFVIWKHVYAQRQQLLRCVQDCQRYLLCHIILPLWRRYSSQLSRVQIILEERTKQRLRLVCSRTIALWKRASLESRLARFIQQERVAVSLLRRAFRVMASPVYARPAVTAWIHRRCLRQWHTVSSGCRVLRRQKERLCSAVEQRRLRSCFVDVWVPSTAFVFHIRFRLFISLSVFPCLSSSSSSSQGGRHKPVPLRESTDELSQLTTAAPRDLYYPASLVVVSFDSRNASVAQIALCFSPSTPTVTSDALNRDGFAANSEKNSNSNGGCCSISIPLRWPSLFYTLRNELRIKPWASTQSGPRKRRATQHFHHDGSESQLTMVDLTSSGKVFNERQCVHSLLWVQRQRCVSYPLRDKVPYVTLLGQYQVTRMLQHGLRDWKQQCDARKARRVHHRRNFYVLQWRYEDGVFGRTFRHMYAIVQYRSEQRRVCLLLLRSSINKKLLSRAWEMWKLQTMTFSLQLQSQVDGLIERLQHNVGVATNNVARRHWGSLVNHHATSQQIQLSVFKTWLSATRMSAFLVQYFLVQHRVAESLRYWASVAYARTRLRQRSDSILQRKYFQLWKCRWRTDVFSNAIRQWIGSLLFHRPNGIMVQCMRRWKVHTLMQRRVLRQRSDTMLHWKNVYLPQQRTLHQKEQDLFVSLQRRLLLRVLHAMQQKVLSALQQRLTKKTVAIYLRRSILQRTWNKMKSIWTTQHGARCRILQKAQIQLDEINKHRAVTMWKRSILANQWLQEMRLATLGGLFTAWKLTVSFSQCHRYWTLRCKKLTLHQLFHSIRNAQQYRKIRDCWLVLSQRRALQQWKMASAQLRRLAELCTLWNTRQADALVRRVFIFWIHQSKAILAEKRKHQAARYCEFVFRCFLKSESVLDNNMRPPLVVFIRAASIKLQKDAVYDLRFHLREANIAKSFATRSIRKALVYWRKYTKQQQAARSALRVAVLQRWKTMTDWSKQVQQWLERERLIAILRRVLGHRIVFRVWGGYYIRIRQALRLIRRQLVEHRLQNTFLLWRLNLRILLYRKKRVPPTNSNATALSSAVLMLPVQESFLPPNVHCMSLPFSVQNTSSGYDQHRYMDDDSPDAPTTMEMRQLILQNWIFWSYRMCWNRECDRREYGYRSQKRHKSVVYALRRWKRITMKHQPSEKTGIKPHGISDWGSR